MCFTPRRCTEQCGLLERSPVRCRCHLHRCCRLSNKRTSDMCSSKPVPIHDVGPREHYVPDSFALPARSQSTPQSLDVVLVVHYTSTYMSIGSPTPSISGMTHFRSNAFASTILKIFWTLIEADVEQNIREACIAFAKRFACCRDVSRRQK